MMTNNESSINQLISINKSSSINVSSINKTRIIKGVGGDGNKFSDISVVNLNYTRFVKIFKLAKSKRLI